MPERLFIQPHGALLFRDGKPFSAFDDTHADCVFPPSPITIQGILRSHWLANSTITYQEYTRLCRSSAGDLANHEDPLVRKVGPPDIENLDFKLRGPFISKDGTRLFPAPADLIASDGPPKSLLRKRYYEHDAEMLHFAKSSPGDMMLLPPGSQIKSAEAAFLTEEGMKAYLEGATQFPYDLFLMREQVYRWETRVGIGLNRKRGSTEEGMLYSKRMVRLEEDFAIEVEIEDSFGLRAAYGTMGIGGEAGTASWYVQKGAWQPPQISPRESRFVLYLATPAIFRTGTYPDFPGCRLLAAQLGRPVPIGGFDIVKRMPREILYAIPGGSVFIFEGPGDGFHGRNLSDRWPDLGFGYALVGNLPE